MPTVEAGLFIIILVLAFSFTFISLKSVGNARGFFRIMAIALFCMMAVLIGSGFEVAATSSKTTTDGIVTWTETNNQVLIPGGEDSYWFGWLFSGFAITNFMLLIKDYKEGM